MKDKYVRDILFSLATFFLLIISVNILLFPEMPGFLGINPHPYLIAILLMSGRFGLKEGLISAIIASIILILNIYLDSQPYFTWNLLIEKTFLLSIVSYFLTAFIVGEMRGFNKSYERSLLRENIELKGERTRLNEQLEIVTQIKEELESRIIGQEETVHSLYQATKALETLEEKEFFFALTKLTARFTGASKVSLYLTDYSSDCLNQVAQFGWDENEIIEKNIPLYDGLFGKVLKNNFILTIKEISEDPDQFAIWEKCPRKSFAYVPISMASVTVGILTIDDIPFLKLNISTIRMLSLIAELAVPALKNIITYQDLQEMVKTDPVTDMLNYDSFLNMTEVEFKKSIRYNLNFSLIFLEIDGLLKIEELHGHDTRIEALKWISSKIKEILRNVDISGVGPRESQFSIALPVTDTEGVLAVIDRLKYLEKPKDEIYKWQKQLTYYYGAASYHPSMESLGSMLKIAQNSLEINKSSKLKVHQ